ncbi:MAG: hypothetical protein ACR2QH_06885 [Geminicoccaceae bacterium]
MMTFAVTGGITAALQTWATSASSLMFSFGWFAEQGIVFNLGFLDDPTVKAGLPIVVGFAVAYFFRERTNP